MNIKELLIELEKHTETAEFQAWLEVQKKGLLDKQAELLEKVTKGNAENKTLNERIINLESELSKSQAVVNDTLLSKPLVEKLKQKGVHEILIPELSKTIAETYGLQLANGNAIGKVKEGEKESELTLDQVIDTWEKTASKDLFKPQETRTQSTSFDFKGIPQNQDTEYAAARIAAGLPPEK
jgi:hypothetical protein